MSPEPPLVTSCVTHRMGTGLGAGGDSWEEQPHQAYMSPCLPRWEQAALQNVMSAGLDVSERYDYECVSRHSNYFANCGHDTDYIA